MSIASRPTETLDSFIIFRRKTEINQERRFLTVVEHDVLWRNIVVKVSFAVNEFESGGQLVTHTDKPWFL
jgi:hypothetical protein